MNKGMLNRNEVVALTGLSSSTIRRLEIAGGFPARRQLSPMRIAWLRQEVEDWIRSRESVLSLAA